jgi:hypothetical protein
VLAPLQPTHVWLVRLQTWPLLQFAVEWQLPAVQTPPRQIWPLPHWPSVAQALQVMFMQTRPPVQSPVERQLPATHALLTQSRPLPHWASAVQGAQVLLMHAWPPVVQSPFPRQLPVMQLPERQI